MTARVSDTKERFGSSGDARWYITATVAMFAIAVFAYSGSKIAPLVVSANPERALASDELTGFLLNIALILFAWKRSAELKRASAERDAAVHRAHDLAYIDEVTGLFNRRYLRERIEELRGTGARAGLFLLDLDRFKRINDLYGHAIGDEVLIAVSRRIRNACPPEASCVRLGGDEFAVLLLGEDAREKALAESAEKVVGVLRDPVSVTGTIAVIGASLGIAVRTKRCKDPGAMLKRADIAMNDIRRGIGEGEFVPYFQPIIDLSSEKVIGFEVLARWRHPEKGMLEPGDFIDIAEETGMIAELSLAVMREALSVARSWPHEYKIAVNVSPMQFVDPLVAQRILQVLTMTGFPAARLELEISEKCLLTDLESAIAVIGGLKNAGVSISVDDFGRGYISLAELGAMPFDRIKIDRDFIISLGDDRAAGALVAAVATLGKGLKLPITAEGVETAEIRERLLGLGCDDAQGFLFSKALTAAEVKLGFGFKDAPQPTEIVEPEAVGQRGAA
jgi:diguanylate cyclase (GGDEF)-like protein